MSWVNYEMMPNKKKLTKNTQGYYYTFSLIRHCAKGTRVCIFEM